MCYMSGAQDACRHSTFELSKAAVLRRLKLLIKTSLKPEWEFGLAPFSRDNHIPNVSFPAYFIIYRPFLFRHTELTLILLF